MTQYVFDPRQVIRYRYPTHTNDLIMDREQATAAEAFFVVLEPGEAPPVHVHDDAEQVFYGHVLGFKGLERRAVVLVVNDKAALERARERLYVGLSRARDQLVVCGDPIFIAEHGGADLARRLGISR